MRERAIWELPTSYGAVGATRSADILRHPPTGFRPVVRRVRIGQGAHRFGFAWSSALTWGIQRAAGFRVEHIEAPAAALGHPYVPVTFDSAGIPVAPTATGEASFGPDGSPLLQAGDSVILRSRTLRIAQPRRVVYVVDEPLAKGFACGTLAGSPVSEEQLFLVERDADDSVWLTIRAFTRPATWYAWLFYPAMRIAQAVTIRRYLRALAGPID